jgi:hypothetical protein
LEIFFGRGGISPVCGFSLVVGAKLSEMGLQMEINLLDILALKNKVMGELRIS